MKLLIEEYHHFAVEHGRSTLKGDSTATNKAYDRLQKVFIELYRQGKAAELFDLYKNPDPWVQSWAASHTLEVDEKRALEKLKRLEKANIPHVSTSAKYTILGWQKGELRFLPD